MDVRFRAPRRGCTDIRESVPDKRTMKRPYCCMSRIRTTSESVCPRTTASLLPSGDQ
jgi:hypothetical protein